MLLGKRFLPVTGMPILYNERINMLLLVWLPEPLAVATLMLKSVHDQFADRFALGFLNYHTPLPFLPDEMTRLQKIECS